MILQNTQLASPLCSILFSGFQLKTQPRKNCGMYSSLWVMQCVKCATPLIVSPWRKAAESRLELKRSGPRSYPSALRCVHGFLLQGETCSAGGLVQDPKIQFKYFAHLFLVCHWLRSRVPMVARMPGVADPWCRECKTMPVRVTCVHIISSFFLPSVCSLLFALKQNKVNCQEKLKEKAKHY